MQCTCGHHTEPKALKKKGDRLVLTFFRCVGCGRQGSYVCRETTEEAGTIIVGLGNGALKGWHEGGYHLSDRQPGEPEAEPIPPEIEPEPEAAAAGAEVTEAGEVQLALF